MSLKSLSISMKEASDSTVFLHDHHPGIQCGSHKLAGSLAPRVVIGRSKTTMRMTPENWVKKTVADYRHNSQLCYKRWQLSGNLKTHSNQILTADRAMAELKKLPHKRRSIP
ncbi:hypothetical protein L9F63_009328, partial [Diploptera punctata]